ncbi:MAG: EAL domain-containing protein, partial [Deltaproteobacteria bacterium]
MPTIATVTRSTHVRTALQGLAAVRLWDMLNVEAHDGWHRAPLPRHVDVFVLDGEMAAVPSLLSGLRQLSAGCEFVALREPGAEQLAAELLSLQIYNVVALPTAGLLGAGDERALEAALCNAVEKAALRREQAELRKRLSARDEIFDLVGRATHDGLWEWDLHKDTIMFSPRWKQMLGFANEEIGTEPVQWLDRVHPEEREQLGEALRLHFDRMTEFFQSQHRVRHKTGEYRWMLSRGQALRDQEGRAIKLVGSHTDITTQKVSEERLLHEAFHDSLTGLPNSALLRDRLQRAAAYAKRRPDYLYAVIFLDIDRFKNINDSLGHVEGDHLLCAVAERLRGCVRPVDLVARLGGDEFTLLLDDIGDRGEATRCAERVQRALALPFKLGSQEIYASASIGIAISAERQGDPYDLVRDADTAMSRAKARKHGNPEVFDASMHAQAVHLLGLETSLRRALGRRELRLHYQPIVDLQQRTLCGFEALLRWHSEERGVVQPNDFIPVAEETGLIIPIGRWVLREACQQMMAWRKEHPHSANLFVSVNISARQFTQTDLVEQIATTLRETGFDARLLKLEITESLLIDNVESTAVMLRRLQAMQVRICIDDFGTGYSSLSSLYQLPIHTLKVDRSFVGRLGTQKSHG